MPTEINEVFLNGVKSAWYGSEDYSLIGNKDYVAGIQFVREYGDYFRDCPTKEQIEDKKKSGIFEKSSIGTRQF